MATNGIEKRIVPYVLAASFVMSVLDGIMTLLGVHMGLVKEANPFMESWLASSDMSFMTVKLTLTGLGLTLIYRFRRRSAAWVAAWAVFFMYIFVLSLHVRWLYLASHQ